MREQYKDDANLNARIALHERFSTATTDYHHWIFDRLDLGDQGHVLELGCGTGHLWAKNGGRVQATWQLTLTDLSIGMLEGARRSLGVISPMCEFAQVDAQAIPFSDNSFDAVIASHMLYLVPDISQTLTEIQRVLRQRGTLYAVTNGASHMREIAQMVAVFGIQSASGWSRFGLENGEELLSRHFASVRRLDYADGLVVTEVEPLVAYMLSLPEVQVIPGIETHVREMIAERLDHEGEIRITKQAGMFEAKKE